MKSFLRGIVWLFLGWLLRRLSEGSKCTVGQGHDDDDGTVVYWFIDPYGAAYYWELTPERAREDAWTTIKTADELEEQAVYKE